MEQDSFHTAEGVPVPAVTAAEMRDVDRVAVETFNLGLLQMMENAGRNLASVVHRTRSGPTTILAGNGGNGGGGLCCARHLANRDVSVSVVLDRDPSDLDGAARTQYETLAAMDVPVGVGTAALRDRSPEVLVDALVGYGLDGALRGPAADLVQVVADMNCPTVSLDVPSGMNATTGKVAGLAVGPDRILTLALPKTGHTQSDATLYLADIAIPAGVYEQLDISYRSPFDDSYVVTLAQS